MVMSIGTMLNRVSSELQISEDELVRQGMRAWLEQQLRAVRVEMIEICGRYRVANVEEMEARYVDGTIEETDSWRDMQRLDHLEYKRDRLQRFLDAFL